jgi:hypothetical protein
MRMKIVQSRKKRSTLNSERSRGINFSKELLVERLLRQSRLLSQKGFKGG